MSSALFPLDMAATWVPPKAKKRKSVVPTNSPEAATRWPFMAGHLPVSVSREVKGRALAGLVRRWGLPAGLRWLSRELRETE